jgi:cell division protein FtsQ
LERVKAMNRAVSAAVDAESYRPELLAEVEPRYLRRQKPVDIRRKKFTGKTWPFYRRVMMWAAAGAAIITAGVFVARFALYSPRVLLLKPDQIEVTGNHIVTREAVLQQFVHDRGRSVMRISLDARSSQLQQLPWVEQASVQRILPNSIRVTLTERTPIAFVRNSAELALIDAHGVLLDRPDGEDLQFPIVTGLSENMPLEEREKRMQTYQEFMKDIDLVGFASSEKERNTGIKAHPSEKVSELDLANPKDLRVVMSGLAGPNDSQTVTVHFGQSDFTGKFKMLVENFAQWQASSGRVLSIDLQYSRQVVLNPDTTVSAGKSK